MATGKQRLVWMDRTGREIGILGPAARSFVGIALSPDERHAAVAYAAPGEFTSDIWIFEIARDMATRFTSDPGAEFWPVWSPDGTTIFFDALRQGKDSFIWMKPASGTGEPRELPTPGNAYPQSVAPDGRFLLAAGRFGDKLDILKVSLDGNPRTTPLGIAAAPGVPAGIGFFSLSGDGKWIAYGSRESGREEVYVVDYSGLMGKWRVSTDGGAMPRWRGDGRELFYLTPDWKLMSAAVSTSPTFRVSRPFRVLESAPKIYDYAVTSDGKRVLAWVDAKGEKLPPTKVILNWLAAVGRK